MKECCLTFSRPRFGAESFEFSGAATEDEYVNAGLLQCTAFYLVTLFFMVTYGVLGDPGTGAIVCIVFSVFSSLVSLWS